MRSDFIALHARTHNKYRARSQSNIRNSAVRRVALHYEMHTRRIQKSFIEKYYCPTQQTHTHALRHKTSCARLSVDDEKIPTTTLLKCKFIEEKQFCFSPLFLRALARSHDNATHRARRRTNKSAYVCRGGGGALSTVFYVFFWSSRREMRTHRVFTNNIFKISVTLTVAWKTTLF